MYKIMFYVGLSFALIFLVISIVLFVRNHVAKLIGDVTGWNSKRAIKKIYEKAREEQEKQDNAVVPKTVSGKNKQSATGGEKKKNGSKSIAITSKGLEVEVAPNQSILEAIQKSSNYSVENIFEVEEEMMVLATETGVDDIETGDEVTTLLIEEGVPHSLDREETSVLADEETTLLTGDEETTVLVDEETTLLVDDEETAVLVREDTYSEEDADDFLEDDEETTVLIRD